MGLHPVATSIGRLCALHCSIDQPFFYIINGSSSFYASETCTPYPVIIIIGLGDTENFTAIIATRGNVIIAAILQWNKRIQHVYR